MKLRSPAVLMVIGGVATLVLTVVVVMLLVKTGSARSLSDNAAVIGALVALGGVFTAQMVSIALDDRRAQETRKIEEQHTQEARALEDQRAQEAALQNYLGNVGELLIEQPLHRACPADNLSTVVRVQTLSVLEGLNPERKRILLRFLDESGLIYKHKPVVSLVQANLTGADLSTADLTGDDLHGAYLSEADLSEAKLSEATLGNADLSGANLNQANLSGAYLSEAYLTEANLKGADLSGADLSGVDLNGATGVTTEELERQAKSLKCATMPNGQKYEDWLKDREGRKEDGENNSPS